MKKIAIVFTAALVALCSCGPALRKDGSFGRESFVGKFHGVSVYSVITPMGTTLYIGVNEDGDAVMTHYSTGGKTPSARRVIIVDGKRETP